MPVVTVPRRADHTESHAIHACRTSAEELLRWLEDLAAGQAFFAALARSAAVPSDAEQLLLLQLARLREQPPS
jgi:hypothetical protein